MPSDGGGGHRTAIVLVAHGSRDPRGAAATRALARAAGAARPDWEVHGSYLDHSLPRPVQVLGALEAAGHTRAVLAPLLLTAAYHGRVDVPAEVAAARAGGVRIDVAIADVLGPVDGRVDPLLLDGLCRRLDEAVAAEVLAGGDDRPLDGVVLAAAGTRNGSARGTVGRAAAALGARLGVPCTVAYASAAPPAAGAAVARLRAAGATRVGLAAYFLAPGLLYDVTVGSAREAGAVAAAAPLGDAPELVRLLQSRVESATVEPAPAYAA
ncbi:MAG TPA: CbiX/SirB N-terminal domain-containing protein [Actinoplanes sp.]|jgi:sirohydrochlorin ferrochelatase